jgi:hypothetical protein
VCNHAKDRLYQTINLLDVVDFHDQWW